MCNRWALSVFFGAVGSVMVVAAALASDISLYPPYVYPVAYEHLNRWCGPDSLIINGAEGQSLLHFDQTEREATRFNDPVDPAVVEGWSELAEGAGCLLDGDFSLTYWQVNGPLAIHRLKKASDERWRADLFSREEFVRLPGDFRNWTRNGDALFLAYRRPCSDAAQSCMGVEKIDLDTLDRDTVLVRRGPAASSGDDQVPDVAMVQESAHVVAMIVDTKGTTFCRIDPANFKQDCRFASATSFERHYYDVYRRLTVDEASNGFYQLEERVLYCRAWDEATGSQPMCRFVYPQIEGKPDTKVALRAVLPGNVVLAQADQCLSLGKISADTGVIRESQCLTDAVRQSAPNDLRATLVDEGIFAEEADGVTIPGWDVSVSPGGKWIAIQVPLKGCGDRVPKPETMEPSVGIGTCGQVMVWRLDHFLQP